mgnify:CR=1 FL=1
MGIVNLLQETPTVQDTAHLLRCESNVITLQHHHRLHLVLRTGPPHQFANKEVLVNRLNIFLEIRLTEVEEVLINQMVSLPEVVDFPDRTEKERAALAALSFIRLCGTRTT